jgi:predicted MPP superfamily phosphohydrolase
MKAAHQGRVHCGRLDTSLITRRKLLQGLIGSAGIATAFGGYAVAEPRQLQLTRYRLTPPGWPPELRLKLAILTDFHFCEPWMGLERLEAIVDRANALGADAMLLLGDYAPGNRILRVSRKIPELEWARRLAGLRAPLGVYAVQGNHDWWAEPELQVTRRGPTRVQRALETAGVPLFENQAVRLVKDGRPFWIAGIGDQWAFWRMHGLLTPAPRQKLVHEGTHDLPGTLARITDDAPVVLMAHEPDIFPQVPARVALTVCGHTHGGQVRVFGYSPHVPSMYGLRYVYGHIVEDGRHMIVSAGLGCSALPVRFGAPPEIVTVELGTWPAIARA